MKRASAARHMQAASEPPPDEAPFAVDHERVEPAGASGVFEAESRTPPYDLNAEAAVLSVCICGDAFATVGRLLRPEQFFSEKHRRIFDACASLAEHGRPIDALQVLTRLRETRRLDQVGGSAGLTEILNAAPVAAHALEYAETVARTYRQRRAIQIAHNLADQGYAGAGDDAFIATAVSDLTELQPAPSTEIDILYGPELDQPLEPIQYLCAGLKLAPGAPTIAAGNAFAGKSLAWADVAIAVAMGGQAWGVHDCREGRALILDYDGQGQRVSQERAQRLARARGTTLASLGSRIAYKRRPGFYLDDADALERLLRLLDGFDFCVIDSWRGATPNTDEWKRGPVQIVGDRLELVSTKLGCAIVVVDHNIKPPRDGKSARSAMHDVHGSTAKAEMAQSHFAFEGEEGGQLTHVRHVKERVTGQTVAPFGLRFEDVERDGDPRWGLRVAHVDRDELKAGQRDESARWQGLLQAVRDGLRKEPGAPGIEAFAKRLGMRTSDVRAAFVQLEADGEAVRRKQGRSARLYLTPDAPAEEA